MPDANMFALKLGQIVVAVADWPNIGHRWRGRPMIVERRWLSSVGAWESNHRTDRGDVINEYVKRDD